ncbi:hypothetical protein ACOME3_001292 [Neoechinorhynchus agilis]
MTNQQQEYTISIVEHKTKEQHAEHNRRHEHSLSDEKNNGDNFAGNQELKEDYDYEPSRKRAIKSTEKDEICDQYQVKVDKSQEPVVEQKKSKSELADKHNHQESVVEHKKSRPELTDKPNETDLKIDDGKAEDEHRALDERTVPTTEQTTKYDESKEFENKNFDWIFDPREIAHYSDTNLRTFGVFVILKLSKALQVPPVCVSTALILMHRIFTIGPISESIPRAMYPAACLFIACKSEDYYVQSSQITAAYFYIRPDDYLTKTQATIHLLQTEHRVMGILVGLVKVNHPHTFITVTYNDTDKQFCKEAKRLANDIYVITKLCVLYRDKFLTAVTIRATEMRLNRPAINAKVDWKVSLGIKDDEMDRVECEAANLLDETMYPAERINAKHYDRSFY